MELLLILLSVRIYSVVTGMYNEAAVIITKRYNVISTEPGTPKRNTYNPQNSHSNYLLLLELGFPYTFFLIDKD